MSSLALPVRRARWLLPIVYVGLICLTAVTVDVGGHSRGLLAVMFGSVVLLLAGRSLLQWRSLLASMTLIILFVPIRRYSLPGSLPFNLEPYRLIVALVVGLWLASSLVDPRVRFHRIGLIDRPLAVFLGIVLASLITNTGRVEAVGSDAIKALLFLLSFVLVIYLVASLVRSQRDLDFQVDVLLYGGAVIAFACVIERWTHYNVFNHLSQFVPVLHWNGDPTLTLDSRGYRVLGSSQHPIAMGVALVMLVPLALYRAIATRRSLAWIAVAVMVMGAMATFSRTAIVALAAVAVTMIILKPRRVRRMWPALIPGLLIIHIAMPGTLGTITSAFFPSSGLIAQQQNAPVGSGRLATLGPALRHEFLPDPLVGEGYGTRVTTPDPTVPVPNGPILDDGWLGILLETGVVGAFAFAWIFVRFLRRVGSAARRDESSRGWFLAAVSASVAAYGVSMFFYDAESFIQVTFLFFILLGLGGAGYRLGAYESAPPQRGTRRRSRTASQILAGS